MSKGSNRWRLVNIQWFVLQQFFKATSGTILGMVLFILLVSGFITEVSPWKQDIEVFLGLSFYSSSYFTILGIVSVVGTLMALLYTFWIGLPLGSYLKRSLQEIANAADQFTRGKLDYRLFVEGRDEISQVGKQFNQMADRIEKQVNSLQRLVNENHTLIQRAEQVASLEERRKLARDLHDAVSQQLFAISMTMAALPRLIDSKPDQAKHHLLRIEEMVNHAQQELRGLIMHLRPVTLEGTGLIKGVEQLLQELQQKYVDLEFIWDIHPTTPLDHGTEDHLFRVIQEAISNVLRHSKAKKFLLMLRQKQERIFLSIEDDGVGFLLSDKKKSSYGLTTMKERIEELGGRFELITYPNKGTKIEIRVPIQPVREENENDG